MHAVAPERREHRARVRRGAVVEGERHRVVRRRAEEAIRLALGDTAGRVVAVEPPGGRATGRRLIAAGRRGGTRGGAAPHRADRELQPHRRHQPDRARGEGHRQLALVEPGDGGRYEPGLRPARVDRRTVQRASLRARAGDAELLLLLGRPRGPIVRHAVRAADPALMLIRRNGREVANAHRICPSAWVRCTVRRSSGPAVSAGSSSSVVGAPDATAAPAEAVAADPARAWTVAAPAASTSPQMKITTPLDTGESVAPRSVGRCILPPTWWP